MPLSGTICCRTGEPEDFDTCMGCAMKGDPEPCAHPFPLIMSMRDNKSSRVDAGLSTTTLLGCHRQSVLAEQFEYYESPADFEARFKGTLIHAGLEYFALQDEGIIAEQRFFRDVHVLLPDGTPFTVTLSGKPDVILPEYGGGAGRLIDGKSAGRRKLYSGMEPSDSHIKQVNIYRWLIHNAVDADGEPVSIPIGSAAIWYVGDTQLQQVEVPLWDLRSTGEYVKNLVEDLYDQDLPPIMPSTWHKSRKTGDLTEKRHWMCDRCPLREVCDTYPREGVENAPLFRRR